MTSAFFKGNVDSEKNSVYTVQKVTVSISRFYSAHLWIRDEIGKVTEVVETSFSTGVTSENKTIHTPPLLPSSQSWGVCCFLQGAGTVAQHCMEMVGGGGGGGRRSFMFPSLSW